MRTNLCIFSALALLVVGTARADGPMAHLTGASAGTISLTQRICSDDNLYVHHDGSFEGGIAWDGEGVAEPYDGAFGEAFDLGSGEVECVSLWISQDGWNMGQATDIYVWQGGVTDVPGNVLAVVTGVVFQNIPVWPDGARYDVQIPVAVTGPFTAGSWGDWPGSMLGYYWMVDQDGSSEFSWTHVADGLGFPLGWQHPSIDPLWGFEMSMGIGVHFTASSTPAVAPTWGAVKALFAPGH
jgi:hypothetical protein